ncbi:tRNA glutamyl-Q(34) synthetase GluQRS [Aquabacterium sp. J223]|uniref:tRNA glutamyl-Q(34) synthetase GluQRS n=1 Tax=Aquabacterium sp. J223 TaxID=2898431 RepID=UPI0021ADD65E|nr:tRNA glutamyl-Q(34) synthetase GluQRS [Aquabacterium sp. J223]UUX97494.1 tRNA glutamyl-Q(34) synthetase GluQRS [Aquabacterium sp. J223]
MSAALRYRGRFAPSPTGPLHAGSLVAALGSWLDARAHGGDWLVRIEDVDGPRCAPGADAEILRQLAALGLAPDEPPQWQSHRGARYGQALARLQAQGDVYPCGCSRRDIALALAAQQRPHTRHAEWVYPGTCRDGLHGTPARVAWRLRCGEPGQPVVVHWQDRRLGPQRQDVTAEVGDFVLQRADGLWAYQLAVVVDDAEQGITHVVRGEDLADNTARQIHLQRRLGLPTPRHLHLPLVRDARGEKLSKQHGAPALDTSQPPEVLNPALQVLGLAPIDAPTLPEWQARAVKAWRDGWQDGRFSRPEQETT